MIVEVEEPAVGGRERGFGIMQENRLPKPNVFATMEAMFRQAGFKDFKTDNWTDKHYYGIGTKSIIPIIK